jgi:AraC-like DNA-binding protein
MAPEWGMPPVASPLRGRHYRQNAGLAAFKRDFSRIGPLPPQKWLMRKRLEVARHKMDSEGKRASEVCCEAGFKNLSHFSTACRRQCGKPPTGG